MKQISVMASDVLNAKPEDVYATIADYKNGHPRIVPKENFYDMRVEQGGYGEGTIIRFKMKVLGVEQELYQRVTEPEPGHIIVEQDIDAPRQVVTTFTVTPVEDGRKARVEIATTMNTSPGLQGIVERIVIPVINPRLYRRELKQLEAVAREGKSA